MPKRLPPGPTHRDTHAASRVAWLHAPRRARSDEDRQAKERAILDAALDVFAERGFAEARVEDVAARAGVAKGTIYLYFASKELLFEGLIRTGIAAPIAAASAEAAALDLPFEAVVRALFTRLRIEILGLDAAREEFRRQATRRSSE